MSDLTLGQLIILLNRKHGIAQIAQPTAYDQRVLQEINEVLEKIDFARLSEDWGVAMKAQGMTDDPYLSALPDDYLVPRKVGLPKQDVIPKLTGTSQEQQQQLTYLMQEGFNTFVLADPIVVNIPKKTRKK